MKRFFLQMGVWLCCLLSLLLVGCSAGGTGVVPVTDGITGYAVIDYRELSVEGQMTCLDNGKLLLEFARPETLSGIVLSWDGQQMAMELAGVTVELQEKAVPEGALIKNMLQVLKAPHREGVLSETGSTYTGAIGEMSYTLICDPDTGLPQSLSVPENELRASFTEMKRLPSSGKTE